MKAQLRPDVFLLCAAFLTALAALAAAWIAQYIFGLFPCKLCLYQRLPYYGVVACSLLALMPVMDPDSRRSVVTLIALLFLTTSGIAGFHVGVEKGWWDSSCSISSSSFFSIDDIRTALQKPGIASCDEVPFRFLGLSIATYNMIAGLALASLAFWTTKQESFWKSK
ncbi:MAG: disulfide bond formation protein B [Rhodospirillaceae bacterium]